MRLCKDMKRNKDFKLFAATIGQNVVMDTVDESERDNINKALHRGGFGEKLNTLKNGINTNLTKEFKDDGTELSGGESQKLAISRTFYQDAHFALLDEPSSALDPMSEYQLNQSMHNAAYDKSVIFISHRLSTTRRADRIYMMENGSIIEEGTHEELLRLQGKYCEMWDVQAGRYKEMHIIRT